VSGFRNACASQSPTRGARRILASLEAAPPDLGRYGYSRAHRGPHAQAISQGALLLGFGVGGGTASGGIACDFFHTLLRREIEAWKTLSNPQCLDAMMFPSAVGTPLRGGNFLKRRIKPVAERLGIDPRLVTFQVLRRSFATRNQKRGSMKDVQEHLRHARIETTGNVYMQAIPESVRNMVDADIADVLAPVTESPTVN
jgi:hypothetical protein